MISFRVSADDAPILAKQFEPQFEPNDLLQMHNRHFIINMVINGEKAPAFSATTLTLPPAQIDNTGHIIENTRRRYSRSRADVEAEISAVVQPVGAPKQQPAQPAAPKAPSAPAKPSAPAVTAAVKQTIAEQPLAPLETSITPATTPTDTPAPETPAAADGEAKKKRKRRRKRKTGDSSDGATLPPVATPSSATATPQNAAPEQKQPSGDSTELRLR